jgi:hypothetical protein
MPGQNLDAHVVNSFDQQGICLAGVPTYGPVGAWTWTLESPVGSGGQELVGMYRSSNGACQGETQVSLTSGEAPLRVVLPDGGQPRFTLYRRFSADADASAAATCPSSCDGFFGATVTRVN